MAIVFKNSVEGIKYVLNKICEHQNTMFCNIVCEQNKTFSVWVIKGEPKRAFAEKNYDFV